MLKVYDIMNVMTEALIMVKVIKKRINFLRLIRIFKAMQTCT